MSRQYPVLTRAAVLRTHQFLQRRQLFQAHRLPRGHRLRRVLAPLALVGVLLLGACSTGDAAQEPVDIDPTPQAVQEELPQAETDQLWLPYQFGSLALVDPQWESATVKQLDGFFAAMRPGEKALTFSVTDSEGNTLWRAQRAKDDAGFVLTSTEEGQKVAVLTESGATSTTASGYALTTGERLWGPVEVPGPVHGPGLVFGPSPSEEATGAEAVALSADDGAVVSAEDLAATRILGEFDGVLLSVDAEMLRATEVTMVTEAPGTEDLWQLPLAENDWPAEQLSAPPQARPGEGLALLETAPSSDSSESTTTRGALLEVSSGKVLATGIQDVLTDTATGSTVYLRTGKIHGENQQADDQWEAAVGSEAQLSAAGGAIVYVLVDDSIRAYNVLTGEVAEAYDPSGSGNLTVPEIIAPSGAALLHAGEQRYLATTLPGEDVDLTGRG